MTIKALRDKKAGLIAEANALTAKVADGTITDVEAARLSAIMDDVAAAGDKPAQVSELTRVNQAIAQQERLMDEQRSMAPAPGANAETAGERAERTAPTVPAEAKKKFGSLGEQMVAIANAGKRIAVDDRLEWQAASGMNEGGGQDGGYLIQQDFVPELMSRAYDRSDLLSRTRQLPVSPASNGVKINALKDSSRANGTRFGGVQSFWTGEGQQKVGSQLSFRQMDLRLHKLTGLLYATDELLEDAVMLNSFIPEVFGDEFAFKIDDAIFEGSGAGMPAGVMKSAALVTIAAEGGQAADTVVVENIVKMWARLWLRSRQSAIWTINQQIEPQLMLMKIGNMPIYLPQGSIAGQPYATLLGRPIVPTEFNSQLGDKGDIALMDLQQYLTIQKGGLKQDVSIHARFINDETTFRFVLRMDGQPIWDAPLTPFKGADTLSPFVTLADRP
ncbi:MULTISPECIES: phage major capsid protein [unclassified Bradyrhizobium]|uniref:phage major capsid protein n=1 Tax=Bradyrhizobium sp. USDA 4541 TaxID=2817704 RepID=UPI0020A58E0E|nr:phage major capsid protein [Bradyrhizobium sp. USDA 4541]MCP1852803.1 HK97 family phage major capsid protein [Bradyrhizobium sp. USDA 4541]